MISKPVLLLLLFGCSIATACISTTSTDDYDSEEEDSEESSSGDSGQDSNWDEGHVHNHGPWGDENGGGSNGNGGGGNGNGGNGHGSNGNGNGGNGNGGNGHAANGNGNGGNGNGGNGNGGNGKGGNGNGNGNGNGGSNGNGNGVNGDDVVYCDDEEGSIESGGSKGGSKSGSKKSGSKSGSKKSGSKSGSKKSGSKSGSNGSGGSKEANGNGGKSCVPRPTSSEEAAAAAAAADAAAPPPATGAGTDEKTTAMCDAMIGGLDVWDVGSLRMSTVRCLPPPCIAAIQDLNPRLPPQIFAAAASLSQQEVDVCIATFLNELPSSTRRRFGPRWLEIVPRLSEGTWVALDDAVLRDISFEGLVANLNTEVYKDISFVAFNKFPDEFYTNAPFSVIEKIPAGTWARIDSSKIMLLRTSYRKRLPWAQMSPMIRDGGMINDLGPEVAEGLPWVDMMPSLSSRVFSQLDVEILNVMPQEAWALVSAQQLRSIKRTTLTKITVDRLSMVQTVHYKSLNASQLQALRDAGILAIVTNGEIVRRA